MRLAGDVADRADRDALALHVDEELAEAIVPGGVVARRGADQCDHIVAEMRAAGPDLAAVHEPAAVDLLAGRSPGGEVRARIRFANADAEVALAAGDARPAALTDRESAVEGTRAALGGELGG